MNSQYWTYILSNDRDTVLYVGVTNDLERRVYEHKHKMIEGFTKKYNVNKLVWFQEFNTPKEAIEAEKKLKGWTRARKVQLIERENPEWIDRAPR